MDTKIKDEFGNMVDSSNKIGTAFWREYGPGIIIGAGIVVLLLALAWVLFY
jgi:hypothetical protein